jgi:enoyl-CoA hydratase/carnithine racemase
VTLKDILFDRIGEWGVVTLNRQEALNALTWDMAKAMRAQLVGWERAGDVKAVLIRGAGEKAFCAGGDIRWLHDAAKADPAHACGFFHEEYRLNAAIHHFSKPYVALIDGVVMGGGVGLSVHGDFRVAGDRTLFAMPETGIGLFPDVGGGYFLPRLHDGLGFYYGLTGARARAADAMAAGIATHYTPTDKSAALQDALFDLSFGGHAHADIEAVLDAFCGDPGPAAINDMRPGLQRLFQGRRNIEEVFGALASDGGDLATDVMRTLERMSPTSLKVTFWQLRSGARLDFDDVMRMEYRIVQRIMRGADFFEGVRAVIIDKDKAPKWTPARLADVRDADIDAYFEREGVQELMLP